MGIDTNVLTTAGMMKMPFSASSSSGKMRLYCFLNQKPEDIAKIRSIFKQQIRCNPFSISNLISFKKSAPANSKKFSSYIFA